MNMSLVATSPSNFTTHVNVNLAVRFKESFIYLNLAVPFEEGDDFSVVSEV